MLDDSLKSEREAVRQIDRKVEGQTDKTTDRQTKGYCLKTVWLLYESLKPTIKKNLH